VTACPICEHADRTGSWPTSHDGTHCSDCHHSWRSLSEAHCTVCHEQFVTAEVAEAHWHHRRHLDPADVPALFPGPDGVWSTSPNRAELIAHRRANLAAARLSRLPQSGRPANAPGGAMAEATA